MKFTQETVKEFEKILVSLGYVKYIQGYNNGDYCYWRQFEKQYDSDGDKYGGYLVGFNFYDFSKYPQFTEQENISVAPGFLLGTNLGVDRLDITITDEIITIKQFENFCKKFYDFYLLNKFNNETKIYNVENKG